MSAIGREQIYVALEAFLQKTISAAQYAEAVTVTRSVKHYSEVSQALMPYVGILQKGESAVRKRGLDAKVTLQAVLLIYTNGKKIPGVAASTIINNILDTLDNVLDPDALPGNTQQLGLPGIVEHAWIEGKVEIYEAILVDTSICIVPVHILCTG
jgi:hypothetical protein